MSVQKTTKPTSDQVRQKLKLKHLEAKKKLSDAHPYVDRFFKDRGLTLGKIREHSAKLLGAGALAGALILNPPPDIKSLPTPNEVFSKLKTQDSSDNKSTTKEISSQKIVVDTLKTVLPKAPRPLSRNEEKFFEQIFENVMGVKTRATLEGEHLNTTFGYIGAEQHLKRYPGDSLSEHGDKEDQKEGIAPGLGAWGYFSKSKEELAPDLVETEKWYAVVQTLYLPDWNVRTRYLREWYKYRKVLIVNTNNGNAVVASIADSGPAAWTGKQFGGSPEVMDYLGGKSYKKGPVMVFFVDDPENKIPLGPVEYNKLNLPSEALISI